MNVSRVIWGMIKRATASKPTAAVDEDSDPERRVGRRALRAWRRASSNCKAGRRAAHKRERQNRKAGRRGK